MKIALISDTHSGCRNDSSLWYEYQGKFYQNVFFPELEKRGIDTIVHGGDYFDRRKYINFKTLEANYEHFIKPMAEHGIHMHLLVGNHDVAYKTTNRLNSPELILENLGDNIHTYSEPTELRGLNMLLVPWINEENFDDVLSVANNSDMPVCFGHFEFSGFEMNKGYVIEHGMSPSYFEHFDLVLSGHYHTRSRKGNVMYLGSPFEYTWSDFNDPKGFYIFDTETQEMEFIQNPYSMFVQIEYNNEVTKVTSANNDTLETLNGKFVKVIVHSKDDLYEFDRALERIYNQGPHDVQIMETFERAETTLSDEEVIERTKDTPQLINDYVDALPDDDVASETKSSLKGLLQELYSNAESEEYV